MKNILTGEDIQQAREQGKKEVIFDEKTIVTDIAKEAARRFDIQLVKKEAAPKTATVAEKKEPQRATRPPSRASSGGLSREEVMEWKKEFPILDSIIHVGNCSQSPQSKRVRQAIEQYMESWLSIGMDWEYWIEGVIEAKNEFARLINADPVEVAVSTSVSEATSSIASSINWRQEPRKRVITTEAEFPTVNYVWLAHQKYGCKVDFIPVRNGKLELEDYDRLVDEETKMVSTTHVYYQNGFKQDVKAIADIVHSKGSLLLLDDYQSSGTHPIDVREMDIDLLTTGNLKYLLGIPGIAFIYCKKELLEQFKPSVTGWFGQENPFDFHIRYLDYAQGARRFETGTPPVIAAFAANEGMRIINEVGPQRIKEHIEKLSEKALNLGSELGLNVISPFDVTRKGPTTAIQVAEDQDSHHVEEEMKKKNIIVSARGEAVRVAPHFFTLEEEIETVMHELARVLNE